MQMRRFIGRAVLLAAAAAVAAGSAAAATAAGGDAVFGFSASQGAAELALEQRFDAQLDAADLRAWLKTLSAEPNHVGSPHDKANAEVGTRSVQALGLGRAHRNVRRALSDAAPPRARARGADALRREPDRAGGRGRCHLAAHRWARRLTTNTARTAMSRGELVYLNYGMPEDYKELARRGIDVKGKIVITRYGGGWRGLKPKLAQEHGAVGCIIYSDPHDDGYARGDVYPRGGWRPPGGVQRGSVLDMTLYPGDPLTPGVGATQDAKRLPISQARDHPEDPGAADLLRRRAAVAGSARRSGGAAEVARRAAHHLSHRTGAGAGAPVDQLRLEPEAALRRDRADSRRRGSGRMGRARQPSRRLGVRRLGPAVGAGRDAGRSQGDRRAAQERLAAEAHPDLRQLGRRGAGPARLDRVGRDPRRRLEPARRCCTSTPTPTRAASSAPAAAIRCSTW